MSEFERRFMASYEERATSASPKVALLVRRPRARGD
jgi:hypothetical protein